jgi:etoposide-induced 2.4 mRNA
MAMRAHPLPLDPYNPSFSVTGRSGYGDGDDQEVVRHPSPFVPIRIPVFALVIRINDAIVRMLNTLGGRPVGHPHRRSLSVDYKRGRYGRRGSDAEGSAEEGKKIVI